MNLLSGIALAVAIYAFLLAWGNRRYNAKLLQRACEAAFDMGVAAERARRTQVSPEHRAAQLRNAHLQ